MDTSESRSIRIEADARIAALVRRSQTLIDLYKLRP